jgi:transcriptional regulator with XRE-family HTH domain
MKTTPKTFGREVRQSRLFLNETLPAVAKRAGLSKGHLSQIENGKGNPSLTTILALCRALYVSPSDLL